MPMPTEMGVDFTAQEIADLQNHFNGILSIMNAKKVVQLTAKERQSTQSIADERFPYTENAINNLAPMFPALQPGFLSLTDAQADFSAAYKLRSLTNLRNEVNDRMVDFSLASEFFAYQYMREFYNVAKRAQDTNTTGADTVVDALKGLFEAQGDSNNTPTP